MVTPPVKVTTLSTPPKRRFVASTVETIVLIIVAVLLYVYLVSPKISQLATAKKTNSELLSQKAKLEDQKTQFLNIQRKVEDPANKSLLDKLDAALPARDYVPRLYAALEDVVARSAIRGGSIRVDFDENDVVAVSSDQTTVSAERATAIIPVNVSGAATIDQIQSVLGFIERSPRLLSVKNIELKPGSDNLLLFTLELEAYSYLPKSDIE